MEILHEYLHVNLECNRYKLLNQNCIVKYHEKKMKACFVPHVYFFVNVTVFQEIKQKA